MQQQQKIDKNKKQKRRFGIANGREIKRKKKEGKYIEYRVFIGRMLVGTHHGGLLITFKKHTNQSHA
jgi:hypothetical protein